MTEHHNPKTQHEDPKHSNSGQKTHYPNPRESVNPDAATLKDQWKFSVKRYIRWSSLAWSSVFVAGGACFALGWIIKGANPLQSKPSDHPKSVGSSTSAHNQQQN